MLNTDKEEDCIVSKQRRALFWPCIVLMLTNGLKTGLHTANQVLLSSHFGILCIIT